MATRRCARAYAHPSPAHPIDPSMHDRRQAIARASDAQLGRLTRTMTTSEVRGLGLADARRGRPAACAWVASLSSVGSSALWQVHALAGGLFESAMPTAPEELVREHQQALNVGSFDQCCATVLRTVQAVADGSRAAGAGMYVFNNTCSNQGGAHWIALHYEVGVAPEAGDGLACRGAGGSAPGTAGPSADAAVRGGPALQRRLPFRVTKRRRDDEGLGAVRGTA